MKKSVCLIIPPSVFLLDERVFVSLGVLKVAASLEAAGHVVELLDLSGVSNYEEVAALHCASSDSEVFGVTTTTPQMPASAKIVRAMRGARPHATYIIGGPHPTLVHAAARRETKNGVVGRATVALSQLREMFDVVVAGDGEDAVLDAITRTPALDGCGMLIDADDPKGSLFMTNARLEATPYPARHLVDMDSYNYTIDGVRATSVVAQLGCPFGCGFCGGRESPMLRRIRTRSTESIIHEIDGLHREYGYRGFMFYDDELNVNKSMVELMDAIADLQRSHGTEFRLRGFVKAELFDERQATAMYDAGFRWLLTGFESGSPRILDNINKRATVDDNTRCFEIARAHGLKVKALMSIGHPGESRETVRETEEWLRRMRPDDFDVTIITTYPGSPYYDHAVQSAPGIWTYTCPRSGDTIHAYGLDYNEVADYYKGAPDGGYRAYIYTDHLTSEELVTIRDDLERMLRVDLGIPFNASAASVNYEHSMGQLPSNILRVSRPPARRMLHLPVFG